MRPLTLCTRNILQNPYLRLHPSGKQVISSNFAHSLRHASTETASSSGTRPSRLRTYLRRAVYTGVGAGTLWIIDREYNASALARNVRTLWTCMVIALDYKLNFTPEKTEEIPHLHERVAERIYDLLTSNGGLYIKIGQAIANNGAFLPRPVQQKFAKLFDDAPQIPYSDVESVFLSEYGRPPTGPHGVFEEFEKEAAASASIAQVHRAKLRTADGTEHWVAVKVQKPNVGKQVEWDLGAYRLVMWVYENYLFDLPVYFAVDFITDHLRRELDFELEAENAMRTASLVASEPRLADKVYIPEVYTDLSTKKILVMEWIEGVRLSDRPGIERLMGEDKNASKASRKAALNGGVKTIMQTMVELFSVQIFEWGWVHCDPHPGNIIVRPHPTKAKTPQFVLLDHGLYVQCSNEFRQQYATLWKGLLTADFDIVRGVAERWGIGTPDLFASATLLRPVRFAGVDDGSAKFDEMTEYERSVAMKAKLKNFLTDTDRLPKALLFIGRNMRIVQGNNQSFGSPVNRIRITGYWASRSLVESQNLTLTQKLHEYYRYLIFLTVMFTIDVAFWTSKINQRIRRRLGLKSEGFEDELERTMRGLAKSNFGVDISTEAFEG